MPKTGGWDKAYGLSTYLPLHTAGGWTDRANVCVWMDGHAAMRGLGRHGVTECVGKSARLGAVWIVAVWV